MPRHKAPYTEEFRHQIVERVQAGGSPKELAREFGRHVSSIHHWVSQASRKRPPSTRATANRPLLARLRTIHQASDATYGRPRILAELRAAGVRVGHNRVARLMHEHGIRGVSRRRGYVVTTRRDPHQRPAPDLVKQEFTASGPHQLWVEDMTYIPTWTGFLYLAVVGWMYSVAGWWVGPLPSA